MSFFKHLDTFDPALRLQVFTTNLMISVLKQGLQVLQEIEFPECFPILGEEENGAAV